MPDVLYIFDLDGRRAVYVNHSVGEALGYTPQTVIAHEDGLLPHLVHPDDLPGVLDHVRRTAEQADGEALEHDCRMRHANGTWRWLRSRNVVFSRHPDGRARELLGVARDITGRRGQGGPGRGARDRVWARLYEAEQRARLEAEATTRIRDEFLAVAAHELKTPIASLKGFAQLELRRLRRADEPDPERTLHALEIIHQQADRLSRLVNELLDVERLASGRLALEPGPADLAALVRRAVGGFLVAGGDHTISVQAPAALPGQVDEMRLEQVLLYLLDNAVSFSPRGGRVEVSLTPHPGGVATLAVRDHGPGVRPAHRATLFQRGATPGIVPEPGQPGGTPGGTPTHGLGLGLYLCRQIVELHGGTIGAEFPADGGTRVVVTLPLAGPPDA